jgi:glycosyltransferase involved in cell wall biosynthesis
VGIASPNIAAGNQRLPWHRFFGSLLAGSAKRYDAARSFAMDGSWLAHRSRTRAESHSHAAAVRSGNHRQAMERFHLQDDRVVAVPHAAASIFQPAPGPREGPPYFLYVGTLEPRKNVQMLIDVWREVRKQYPVDLILAGRRRADFPEIASEPGLQLLGLTPEKELPKLYSGAIACVYPSYYEGFGLPVLEAMQCGAAVIASSDAAISEVAGDAAVLVDVNDERAWLQALRISIEQPDRIQAMREKALARAALFSWSNTARLTREVYGKAVERFRKKS